MGIKTYQGETKNRYAHVVSILPTDIDYHTTEREYLTIFKYLEEVQWVAKGSAYAIQLYTDHQALMKVLKREDRRGRLTRWQPRLGVYDLGTKHVLGKTLL